MMNVLIDQNCKWLSNEDSKKHLENYDKKFIVGIDLKQRDHDETLAAFCKDHDCDLLTSDKTAYIHFFREKKINTVQLSEFIYEDKADRPIYLVRIVD